MPDQGVLPAGLLDVASEPGGGDRVVEGPSVAEQHVVGEAAGQHPRHLGDVRDLRRPEEGLRVGDLAAVPAQRRSARSVRRAPRAGWTCRSRPADQQHELAGLHGQVEVADPIVPSSWIAEKPGELQALQRHTSYRPCRTPLRGVHWVRASMRNGV